MRKFASDCHPNTDGHNGPLHRHILALLSLSAQKTVSLKVSLAQMDPHAFSAAEVLLFLLSILLLMSIFCCETLKESTGIRWFSCIGEDSISFNNHIWIALCSYIKFCVKFLFSR